MVTYFHLQELTSDTPELCSAFVITDLWLFFRVVSLDLYFCTSRECVRNVIIPRIRSHSVELLQIYLYLTIH